MVIRNICLFYILLVRFFRIIINPYIVSGDFEQLSDADVAAGVRVAWFNWHTYRDVTEDLNRALAETVRAARGYVNSTLRPLVVGYEFAQITGEAHGTGFLFKIL